MERLGSRYVEGRIDTGATSLCGENGAEAH